MIACGRNLIAVIGKSKPTYHEGRGRRIADIAVIAVIGKAKPTPNPNADT